MAAYTELHKPFLEQLGDDYNLGRILGAGGIPQGSVNSNYLIETAKGTLPAARRRGQDRKRGQARDRPAGRSCASIPFPARIRCRTGWAATGASARASAPRSTATRTAGSLPPERLRPTQLETIGRTLGELHVIGKGYKKGIDNRFSFERIADLYLSVRGRLPNYFRKISRTLEDEVDYLTRYLEGKLPKGVIHGDLFADNVLFRGEKLTAVLDFEAACRGKFIFDLATAVNALCFVDGQYSLDRFRFLLHGYESVRTLSLAEWDAFPNELRYSSLRFTVTRLHDFFLHPLNDDRRVHKDFREFFDRLRILRREREGGMEALLMAMATGYDYRKYQKVKANERLKA